MQERTHLSKKGRHNNRKTEQADGRQKERKEEQKKQRKKQQARYIKT